MSIIEDNHGMLKKYGTLEWMQNATPTQRAAYREFRVGLLKEELQEIENALKENDPEEMVDGLVDLVVVAIGTLNVFGVDAERAWNEVHRANMQKEVGVKATRPNPLGLPDLVKPAGWVSPNHAGNHGFFTKS